MDFGDGTTLQSNNPVVFHQYAQNGLYDITLVATNISTGCTETLFKDDWIFCAGGTVCTHTASINQSSPINACHWSLCYSHAILLQTQFINGIIMG